MHAIRLIAARECLEILRDGRFRGAALIVAALLCVALGAGWSHHREVSAQHARAQQQTREHWLAQPAKDPHSAAHYGIYAFKPRAPLTLFDTGVEPYTGVAAWLEAHKQNEFQYRPAQDRTAIVRFGELTAAATLQYLVPILIVLLAVETFAGEREQGTLRQLLASGVPARTLTLGKLAGIGAALAMVVGPAALIGAVALVWTSGSAGTGGAAGAAGDMIGVAADAAATLARALPLAAVYLVFFGVIAALSLAVSARAASVRQALAILIAAWALNAVVAPRVASEIGRALYPTPTAFSFGQQVHDATYDGLDVHEFTWRRARELRARLLRDYRVTRVEELPVNFRGMDYLEREAHANDVFDQQYGALWQRFGQQNAVQQWAGAAAPLLAVRALSAALAGTDFSHHQHFAAAAETYRRMLVQTMNEDLAHGSSSASLGYTAGPELWARVPAFTYRAPSPVWALGEQRWSLLALAGWALVAIVALRRTIVTLALRVD